MRSKEAGGVIFLYKLTKPIWMSTIYQTNGNKQELEANLYTSEKHIMVKTAEQNNLPMEIKLLTTSVL